MFENITEGFQKLFSGWGKKSRLSQGDIQDFLPQVRDILLEADVAYQIIDPFLADLGKRLVGQSVIQGLQPDQVFMKHIYDALVELFGEPGTLALQKNPSVILMVGTQGSGKTSMTAKLAHRLMQQKKKVFLASTDVYRPAAREQLALLGQKIGCPVLSIIPDEQPLSIAGRAIQEAKTHKADVILIDTAGRLPGDMGLMRELLELHTLLNPEETLFVGDALMGQETLRIAHSFHACVPITGIAFSRVDSDGRAGALLSVRMVLQKPIVLLGTGELPEQYENLSGEQLASRLLGMGDHISLIEKVMQEVSQAEMNRLENRMKAGLFSYEDMLLQLVTGQNMSQKMGGFDKLLNLIPGAGGLKNMLGQGPEASRRIKHNIALIRAMTPAERREKQPLTLSRKQRIARGSGLSAQAVDQLIQEHAMMKNLFRMMGQGSLNPKDLFSKLMRR